MNDITRCAGCDCAQLLNRPSTDWPPTYRSETAARPHNARSSAPTGPNGARTTSSSARKRHRAAMAAAGKAGFYEVAEHAASVLS